MILALGLCACAFAQSASTVPARQPLTYKDSGIYGWWQPYFWEGPFDFVVTQAIVVPGDFTGSEGTNNATDLEHIKVWNENLMKARAAGKRVLAVCSPGQGRPFTEEYFQHLEQFLANVNTEELYAISLGEENISASDWVAALTDGYHRIKKQYPDLPIYQFYSCYSRADARPGFEWPLLPSDGWLSDEYVATPDDFEQAVRRYRMLGKPFVNIIWAAPFYSSSRQTSVPYHQSIFDGQLRVSEKYNVSTAYFCWDGPIGRFWSWHEQGEQENKDVFKLILDSIARAKTLPDTKVNDWDDASKPAPTVLNEDGDNAFSYRESYDLWTGLPGSNPPPLDDFMSRSQICGLRQMTCPQDPSRIVVSADGEKPVDAAITNHWTAPEGQSLRLKASAQVMVEPGSEVILEVSPNGYDWIARASTKESSTLTVDLPAEQAEVYTRLRIIGNASAGKALGSIDWIEVRGEAVR
jgi:hypothetical protein